MSRFFAIVGAAFGMFGVVTGAFGAHALSAHFDAFPNLQATYETAVQYQFYHAFALFVVAWAVQQQSTKHLIWAGYLFTIGIVLFSGSLYLLAVSGMTWLGAITPIGGVAFLAGWGCLGMGLWRAAHVAREEQTQDPRVSQPGYDRS